MYQLVLGIGWEALKTRFESYDENSRAGDWKKLDQHKILLNSEIMKYYIKMAEAEEYSKIDSVKQYLAQAFINKRQSESAKANGDNLEVIWGNYFKNKPEDEVALVYGPTDRRCSKSKCPNQFDITSDIFDDKKSIISLHSPDNFLTLLAGDSARPYLKFIEHMVSNEEIVNFIDPFIAENESSRKEFCERYLPKLTPGSTVNVYLDANSSEVNLNKIKQEAEKRNLIIHIFLCDKTTMHDRFITTKEVVLAIGAGILFYRDNRNPEVREVTAFNYIRKPKRYEGHYEEKLAGDKIRRQFC